MKKKRPSRIARANTRHISYKESSSDSDLDSVADCPPPKRRQLDTRLSSSRKLRSSRLQPSQSTISEDRASDQPIQKPSKSVSAKARVRYRKFRSTEEQNVRNKGAKETFNIPKLGGRIPPWQSLPYQTLLMVFQFASSPSSASASWLARSARICRAFAEPALSELYYSPPLLSIQHVRGLLETLMAQDKNSYINYRAKVKHLDLDSAYLVWKEPVKLDYLINLTPQLRGLDIQLVSPHHAISRGIMFKIPKIPRIILDRVSSILDTISQNDIRLVNWSYNIWLVDRDFGNLRLPVIFERPSFQTLRTLALAYVSHDSDTSAALAYLPCLNRLSWKNCTFAETETFVGVPRNLESLEFSNCESLTSELLGTLLESGGKNLRQLSLDYNQSLNLAFLPNLKTNCPRLEAIKMDLIFYNNHVTYQDIEPKFNSLLLPDETPTWPSAMQRIELHHLRKWLPEATETFFASLVNTSATLPDLRHIDIKVTLEESGWRERKAFRDRWVSTVERVFQRHSKPPKTYLQSIRMFKKWKKLSLGKVRQHNGKHAISQRAGVISSRSNGQGCGNHNESDHMALDEPYEEPDPSDGDASLTLRRRSDRLRRQSDTNEESSAVYSERRTRRRRRRHHRKYSDESSSSEDSALNDAAMVDDPLQDGNDNKEEYHIQGMCDVVRVVINNLRPNEEQMHESDFLDEEVSGDEDWNGDDTDVDNGYAW